MHFEEEKRKSFDGDDCGRLIPFIMEFDNHPNVPQECSEMLAAVTSCSDLASHWKLEE